MELQLLTSPKVIVRCWESGCLHTTTEATELHAHWQFGEDTPLQSSHYSNSGLASPSALAVEGIFTS